MTRRTDSSRSSPVAVGTSRAHASQVFGEHHDDLFLTTYDDIAAEVDLSGPPNEHVSVDVAGHPAAGPALEWLLTARTTHPELRLRVEFVPGDPAGLRDLLDRHPEIGIDEVARIGSTTVVGLAPMPSEEALRSRLALGALDLLPPPEAVDAGRLPDAPASEQPPPAAAPVPLALRPAHKQSRHRRAATPPPATVRLAEHTLDSVTASVGGGRRRAALLISAGSAVVYAVLLLAVGLSPLGVSGVLVVIGLSGLLGLAILMGLALLVQRDLHRQRLSQECMMRRQGRQLRQRTDTILAQQRAVRRAQADLPFLRQYLEALDEAGSSLRAQLSEWFEDGEHGRRP